MKYEIVPNKRSVGEVIIAHILMACAKFMWFFGTMFNNFAYKCFSKAEPVLRVTVAGVVEDSEEDTEPEYDPEEEDDEEDALLPAELLAKLGQPHERVSEPFDKEAFDKMRKGTIYPAVWGGGGNNA